MRLVLISLATATVLACPSRGGPSGTAAPDATASSGESTEEACLDRWLSAHNLDPYGSSLGTTYAGGSPLFDEGTGKMASRAEFVYAKHPDARRACAPAGGELER